MTPASVRIVVLSVSLSFLLSACAPPEFQRSVQVEFYCHGILVQRSRSVIGDRATFSEIWNAPADERMIPDAGCTIVADSAEMGEATLRGIVEIRIHEGARLLGKATVVCVHLSRDSSHGAWYVHQEEMAFIKHAAGL